LARCDEIHNGGVRSMKIIIAGSVALGLAMNIAQPRTALAWGDHGHKVVALIAQSFLETDVRMRVNALLAPTWIPSRLTTSRARRPGRTNSETPTSAVQGNGRGSGTS